VIEVVHVDDVEVAVRYARMPKRTSGQYRRNRNVCEIKLGLHSLDEKITVWHELGHHVLERRGIDTGSPVSEKYLDALDTFQVHILRDNPDLVEYLTS